MIDATDLDKPIEELNKLMSGLKKLSTSMDPKISAMLNDDISTLEEMTKNMNFEGMDKLIKNISKYDKKDNG